MKRSNTNTDLNDDIFLAEEQNLVIKQEENEKTPYQTPYQTPCHTEDYEIITSSYYSDIGKCLVQYNKDNITLGKYLVEDTKDVNVLEQCLQNKVTTTFQILLVALE